MIFEFDDFGCNHVISDMTQSHDCRDVLVQFKKLNPKFKVTLFTIPGEVTAEITAWAQLNNEWVELAVHGFFHQSNYECEKLSYDDFGFFMSEFKDIIKHFVKGFRAPGWQISTEVMRWLADNGYWLADQGYNDDRRPDIKAYINYDGVFKVNGKEVKAHHGHTWNCVGNGIYEQFEYLEDLIKKTKDFQFVSEAVNV